MSSKVVIIGSNSFSGSHFIDHLLSKGIDCIGISRSREPHDVFLPYKNRDADKFEFHQFDINHNLNGIVDIIHDAKAKYVVNFASQGMVAESWEKPEDWYQTNVIAQVKLHDQLRRLDFLKKYVHVTTPEVYGSIDGWINENSNFNPSTPYAVSRAACDMHLKSFFQSYNFPVVFTRAANVYGPGQQLFKIIPRSIIFIKNNEKIPLHGGGLAERSFIHIQDVCEATLKIMEQSKSGEIYNLSTNTLHSIKDIVKLICGRMDVDFEKSVEDVETRRGLDKAYILDSSKAENEFGWKPKISLEEGIDETIKWINDSFVEISKEPLGYVHKE